jgi:hypothetical protein
MAEYPRPTKGSRHPGSRSKDLMKKRINHNAGVRQQLRDDRVAEAKARQAEYDSLTGRQKLARLDKLLGVNQGAVRERARILKQLKTEAKTVEVKVDVDVNKKSGGKKK